jgi:hypothetical protein
MDALISCYVERSMRLIMLMDITFTCECGEHREEIIYVPEPNFTAEKSKDSANESYEQINCDGCGVDHEITVVNTFGGADCYVDNGEIDVDFGMPYYPESDYDQDELEWFICSKTQIEIFNNQIKSVEKLLAVEVDIETYFSLLVMLHGHVVAAIEAYLASTFIHQVTNSDELTRKLIETDPTFSKVKFTLKEIFEKQEGLKLTVATYLKDLIFHDLKKVKPMYKDVLNCEFGDIAWLFKAVATRHHCVHRAGFDKEGKQAELSIVSIKELVAKSVELTSEIEKKVSIDPEVDGSLFEI